MKFCTNCGNRLTDDALFCTKCGQNIAGDTQQFSSQQMRNNFDGTPSRNELTEQRAINKGMARGIEFNNAEYRRTFPNGLSVFKQEIRGR